MASETVNFKVDARAVHVRLLNVVIHRDKVKTKEELTASGISGKEAIFVYTFTR